MNPHGRGNSRVAPLDPHQDWDWIDDNAESLQESSSVAKEPFQECSSTWTNEASRSFGDTRVGNNFLQESLSVAEEKKGFLQECSSLKSETYRIVANQKASNFQGSSSVRKPDHKHSQEISPSGEQASEVQDRRRSSFTGSSFREYPEKRSGEYFAATLRESSFLRTSHDRRNFQECSSESSFCENSSLNSSEEKAGGCSLSRNVDHRPNIVRPISLGVNRFCDKSTSDNDSRTTDRSRDRTSSEGERRVLERSLPTAGSLPTDTASVKILIRQNSVEDLGKILRRQNSLHELDSLRSGHSNERSLSWDHYVDNYRPPDDVLRELVQLREELTQSTSDDEFPELSARKSPNLSKTSSKNTRCSSDVSGFSFESVWNSKQSVEQYETYQSHQRAPGRAPSAETSSGIKSISEDSRDHTSSGRWLPTVDSSEDPYEYDEEIPMEVSQPSVQDQLMLEVLCSERVSQMTRTYNDIEAVTRLLEEKEKDLELTARIGKELLTHNNKLEAHVATLEVELKSANEKIDQLSHELAAKSDLIQVLTNDLDETGSEAGTPTALRCLNAELMQRKVKKLEDENKGLKREFDQLARDTETCEEKEARLVHDITQQLAHSNEEREGMTSDLERQREENRVQFEQIINITAKLEASDATLKQMMSEYDETAALLNITRENQNALALELTDYKERFAEISQMLQDAQEDLRRQRKKGTPAVRGGLFSSLGAAPHVFGMPPADSLASELESSLYSELSLDSGISADRVPSYKKTFETVKIAGSTMQRSSSLLPSTVTSSGPRMSARPGAACTSVFSSTYSKTGDSDTESGLDEIIFPNEPITGVEGAPGSAELADALRRLTPGEVTARRAALGGPPTYNYGEFDATFLPLGCRTPDSIMSTGSSGYGGGRGNPWRLPDKLQIVKPMEGSATLHHWSQLATPHMGGLLEERPGVQTKGGRGLEDIGLRLYTLSDLEEDEEDVPFPGKGFQGSLFTHTYTDSRVMHPDDGMSVTSSLSCSIVGSRLCTGATNSRQSTAPPTPARLSRRNSCSTFSTNAGLAKVLNERGVDSCSSSAMATPMSERSFSPTATPANSPDGSPMSSRSPSPTPFNPLKLPGFLSSGADLLRRTFISDAPPPRSPRRSRRSKVALSRSERKALTGIRIVEKLEELGVEAMIATTAGLTAPTLQGALYARRGLPSPMAQLTSFKTALAAEQPPTVRPPMRGQRRASQGAKVRPDLGTVLGTVPGSPAVATPQEAPSGPLGTISSMLFGRKGGLL